MLAAVTWSSLLGEGGSRRQCCRQSRLISTRRKKKRYKPKTLSVAPLVGSAMGSVDRFIALTHTVYFILAVIGR